MKFQDHAHRLTTLNTYAGQYGTYIIYDASEEQRLDLPRSGSLYDIPLLLSSRFFTAAGNITDESAERTSVYGDTLTVNGIIMPYMEVLGRKYRFRLINVAVSKSFRLKLTVDGSTEPISYAVVGSDAGIMQNVVTTTDLYMGMAERWEVRTSVYSVITFLTYANELLTDPGCDRL